MKFRLNALMAAAVAALAAVGAQANPTLGNAASFGNSTVSFVAQDAAGTTSLMVDLGVQLAAFLPQVSGLTFAAGALSAGPTALTATWNFSTNTYAINGVAQAGTYNWSPVSGFMTASSAAGYQWGVIGSDGVSGAVSASNVVQGNNLLYTAISNDFDVSNASGTNQGAIGGGAGNYNLFLAANGNQGTNTAAAHGANTATGGVQFMPNTLTTSGTGDFNAAQFGTNNFLMNPTDTAKFYLANQGTTTARIYDIGNTLTNGADAALAATWTWDQGTSTLTYNVAAVPEPGTYGMLMAGLMAVGFVVRRRSAR